jgi:hypothetical protein
MHFCSMYCLAATPSSYLSSKTEIKHYGFFLKKKKRKEPKLLRRGGNKYLRSCLSLPYIFLYATTSHCPPATVRLPSALSPGKTLLHDLPLHQSCNTRGTLASSATWFTTSSTSSPQLPLSGYLFLCFTFFVDRFFCCSVCSSLFIATGGRVSMP